MTASDYLTQDEAASYLRISVSAFKKHVRSAVPCSRIGTKPVFSKSDLDTFMTDHKSFTTKQPRRGAGSARNMARSNKRVAEMAQQLER